MKIEFRTCTLKYIVFETFVCKCIKVSLHPSSGTGLMGPENHVNGVKSHKLFAFLRCFKKLRKTSRMLSSHTMAKFLECTFCETTNTSKINTCPLCSYLFILQNPPIFNEHLIFIYVRMCFEQMPIKTRICSEINSKTRFACPCAVNLPGWNYHRPPVAR